MASKKQSGGEAGADDVRPIYAPFFEKKKEWFPKHGLRCYQNAAMNLMIEAANQEDVGLAHLEPGIILAIYPPSANRELHDRKVDAATESAEWALRESTGSKGLVNRLGWSKHYPDFSRDRWADEHEDLKSMIADGSFGFVTFCDMDWLDARLRERASALGLRILDRIMPGDGLKQVRVAKDERFSIDLLRMLVESAVDIYPLEYLLERIDSAAQAEKRLAKWAQESRSAGLEPFDPPRHGGIAPGAEDLNRWRSVAEDPKVSTSPQIAEITKFMEKADGVEVMVWEYLKNKYPANCPGYEGEPALVVAGASVATVSIDKEKGVLVYFDHARSNLQWRIWVLQKFAELASIFRKHREQDGHAMRGQTEGKGHFDAVVRVGKAEEAKGPGKGMLALGVRVPGSASATSAAAKIAAAKAAPVQGRKGE